MYRCEMLLENFMIVAAGNYPRYSFTILLIGLRAGCEWVQIQQLYICALMIGNLTAGGYTYLRIAS